LKHAREKLPPVGFVISINNLSFTESGKPLGTFIVKDRYGPGRDGVAADIDQATCFTRMADVDAWMEAHPVLALRASVIHLPTKIVVRS